MRGAAGVSRRTPKTPTIYRIIGKLLTGTEEWKVLPEFEFFYE